MQCCSRGTRPLRITQTGVDDNASSSLRALIAMQHAPRSNDRRYAEYCGRHPMAGQINSSGLIGQGSCSCFSCHGQMRSTHDVSPQLLAILLWTADGAVPLLPPLLSVPGCHLSRAGRHHEIRFVKSPAHLQAMPCVWLAESRWALKLETTAPKPTHLELVVEPTQRPILHSKLDSKAYRSSLEAQPTPR